ncbi:conserved oligomeric Golgi complex subunit 4-like [Ctenocephalides felis]|uniref:conserved oligomeric Golgi complex subunit 4-like n=1 Tax=Ctenocephalides felis TaxID=7515 RepID=UPI000E6E14D1|nr:conserved oligomeric Golgi complex subunit 4-like [Ctenocephalides felis]
MSVYNILNDEDLSTDEGIEKACRKISSAEDQITKQLENLLSRQNHIESKLMSISKSKAGLQLIHQDSLNLQSMITHTATLAENVSAKVRRLDEARSRVSECQQRVNDLIDLQICSEGVKSALRNEDYEKGAAHVHRFLSMDQSLLQQTATDVAENTTSVSQAFITLQEAAVQIRSVITLKFNEAVKKDDLASVERFFKIFPLLGMHNEGLEQFALYLCTQIQETSRNTLKNSLCTNSNDSRYNILFADCLTVVLESIARVIETQSVLVETYYGPGLLIQLFTVVQKECDRQVKKIIEEFIKLRNIKRRSMQINSYMKNSSNSNAARGHTRTSSSLDKLNPKELDNLIAEVSLMHSRAELYLRFIKKKNSNDIELGVTDEDLRKTKLNTLNNVLNSCELNMCMQELLGVYLLLERYFMEETVLKAINLDSLDGTQHCSSMMDDVFFIVKKCTRRSIATSSIDGICAILNNVTGCLERDYSAALKSTLQNGYPSGYLDLAYSALQTSIQQGRLHGQGDSEQLRNRFIAHLNNADTSSEYVDTLGSTLLNDILTAYPNISTNDREKVDSCLASLSNVTATFKALVEFGMQQLRVSVIKPRVHPWIDDELTAYEAGETFIQTLIVNLDVC